MALRRHIHLMRTAAVAALIAALAGCKTTQSTDTTGSIQPAPALTSESDWRREAESTGERFRSNPRDVEAAIRYARALRATGQRQQAAAVLEKASIQNPDSKAILGAYGRALADVGNFTQALDVLSRAHTPDQPDWRILSVQGAVLDQMGRHEEAQRHYASALRIVPEEPSVLSNLGLSYALSKKLADAEATLRRASTKAKTDKRVRQNLALVVGLQGRFAEAETIARADLPPAEAAANVAYLKRMLAQPGKIKKQHRPLQAEEPADEFVGLVGAGKGAAPISRSRGRRNSAVPAAAKPFVTLGETARRFPRSRRVAQSENARLCPPYCSAITRIAAGPRMTMNSTGRKNRIIGTVSFGGSAAAFFSASDMRMSRFSCDMMRRVWPSGVP